MISLGVTVQTNFPKFKRDILGCCFPAVWYILAISSGDSMTENQKLKPFLVRLRPETRLLLDDAATAQRRSRASLVDQAIVEMLAGRFSRVENRLDQMLGQK